MGYRSDVAITVYGNKGNLDALRGKFTDRVLTLNEDGINDLNSLCERSEGIADKPLWDDETGEFFLYVDHGKWYEGYPVVDLFEWLVREAGKLGLCSEFVQIGEQYDDIQIEQLDGDDECEYRLSVSRSISF